MQNSNTERPAGSSRTNCSGSSALDEIQRTRPVLYAQLDGATCAREGKKMDANPYPETDDLHFQWLQAWTNERLAMMKSRGQNASVEPPSERNANAQ